MTFEPLKCERCHSEVLALVNITDRSDPTWWCSECVRDARDVADEERANAEGK